MIVVDQSSSNKVPEKGQFTINKVVTVIPSKPVILYMLQKFLKLPGLHSEEHAKCGDKQKKGIDTSL